MGKYSKFLISSFTFCLLGVAAMGQTYTLQVATHDDCVGSQSGDTLSFSVSSLSTAPFGIPLQYNATDSKHGDADFTLAILVSSATQPTASGTCTVAWTYNASAGAGSRVGGSSHGESDSEYESATASASGAQTSNDGPNTILHTFTLQASNVSWVNLGGNDWKGTVHIHDTFMTASSYANAAVGSREVTGNGSAGFSFSHTDLGVTSYFTIS
jgi:hypothetical protein